MSRSRRRILDEPLQFKDMTTREQRVARGIASDFGRTMEPELRRQSGLHRQRNEAKGLPGFGPTAGLPMAARANIFKANRMDALADVMGPQRTSLEQAADNRVQMVRRAATTERLPEEGVGGAGWYFDAAREVAEAAPTTPHRKRVVASSIMSVGTDPQTERRALRAIHDAEREGKVTFPDGSTKSWSELGEQERSYVLSNRGASEVRDRTNVDLVGLRGPQRPNVQRAIGVMRGEVPAESAQDPATAPKTWSYTEGQVAARPGSEVEQEYLNRAAHVGRLIRGEAHRDELMLDLYGLRESQEGILSRTHHTAEDSWMRAISQAHKVPEENVDILKGAGDVGPPGKTRTRGDRVENASPNTNATGESIYHAWNNAATTEAARRMETDLGLDEPGGFNIPSVMVQETAWTGVRRAAGADSQYNARMRDEAEQAKQALKDRRMLAKMNPRLPGVR